LYRLTDFGVQIAQEAAAELAPLVNPNPVPLAAERWFRCQLGW
jgi:hypothetical protein